MAEKGFDPHGPGATVPVLELDDGPCPAESLANCHYLEGFPEPNLPRTDARGERSSDVDVIQTLAGDRFTYRDIVGYPPGLREAGAPRRRAARKRPALHGLARADCRAACDSALGT